MSDGSLKNTLYLRACAYNAHRIIRAEDSGSNKNANKLRRMYPGMATDLVAYLRKYLVEYCTAVAYDKAIEEYAKDRNLPIIKREA